MSDNSLTLAERIEQERIVKSTAQPRTLKQLARNPKSINTSLAIQRNLRWTQQQKTALIESVLLGFPVPAVYAIKSEDNSTWILDGKQRLTTFISFLNDEWELEELSDVYGMDITGHKFSELPEEFREILEDHNIVFYQFERLTAEQRDQLFKRLNSGTPLLTVELTRSILGTEILDWINTVTAKPFFNMMHLTEKQTDKFLDTEILLQMIGIVKKEYGKVTGKNQQMLALDLRINGLDDNLKTQIEMIVDYLGQGFSKYEIKEQKKLLKKNDVVSLAGAASVGLKNNVDPVSFAGLTGSVIVKSNGEYKNTKVGGTAKEAKVKKRVDLLINALNLTSDKAEEKQLELTV